MVTINSLVLVLIGMLFAIPSISLADAVSREAERENAIRDITERYTSLAGEPPSLPSVLRSLKVENASGKKLGEVVEALELVTFGVVKGDSLPDAIIECVRLNDNSHLVRSQGVQALLAIDSAKGVELSRHILSSPGASLEEKLSVANHLAAMADDARGYDALRQGLVSPRPYDRTLARSLFMNFVKLNGKAIPDVPGAKVDLKAVLAEAKAATRDTQILTELESLAKEIGPSTAPSKP